MRYLLIILSFFSLSFSIPKPNNISIGMSETMGIYGVINANYNLQLEGWSNDFNHYYITAGVFPIPIFGGAGLAWKHYYNSSRASFFTSVSGFGLYMLPAMCSGDHCHAKFDFLINGSAGLDLYLIKIKQINLHLQLGVLSQYSLGGIAIDTSPSNIPEIWPVINVKFGS